MHIKNKKGQSTVEYVLLVTAVIAVVIAFTTGGFKSQLNLGLNTATNEINSLGSSLADSHVTAPVPGADAVTTPPYSVTVCGGVGQPACAPAPVAP